MPSVEFTPPPLLRKFAGREEELQILKTALQQEQRKLLMVITGSPAIGKTTLANEFVARYRLTHRPYWVSGTQRLSDNVFHELTGRIKGHTDRRKAMVVLDDVELSEQLVIQINALLETRNLRLVMVTTRQNADEFLGGKNFGRGQNSFIHLRGLNEADAGRLLLMRGEKHIYGDNLDFFIGRTHGNPLALTLVAELLKEYTVDQLKSRLDGEFQNLGFELPVVEQQVIKVVAPKILLANEALLRNLQDHPEDLYKISPRRFEELIAELLDDMGWTVEVTPASKDGGKDILAVLQTEIGSLLCLVETKLYRPDRPVQVELVRQLYGTFLDHGANSAMLVTSSHFTRGAKAFQSKHQYQISLREYSDIISWIREYKTRS